MDYPVLLYTGAKVKAEPQIAPQNSLGGFWSNSIIPNAQLFNIFSDIALLSEETINVKCVVLANLSNFINGEFIEGEGVTFKNLRMYFENKSEGEFFTLSMGVHAMSEGGRIQLLNSPYQLPYAVEFTSYYLPDGDDPNLTNTALFGDMLPGKMFVLWLKRDTNREIIEKYFKCDNIWGRWNEAFPYLGEFGYGEITPEFYANNPDAIRLEDYKDFEEKSGVDLRMMWEVEEKDVRGLVVTRDSASDPSAHPGTDDFNLEVTGDSDGIVGGDPWKLNVTDDSE